MSDILHSGIENDIHSTVVIKEFAKLVIGKGNTIGPNVVIGFPGAIRGKEKFNGRVIIGDNNIIMANTIIMAGEDGDTVIGNKNIIMGLCNIGHNCKIGNNNEIGCGTIICGHVEIGNANAIKIGCTIRNRTKIGNTNLIGMGSNVVKDIGNEQTVMGNPAK